MWTPVTAATVRIAQHSPLCPSVVRPRPGPHTLAVLCSLVSGRRSLGCTEPGSRIQHEAPRPSRPLSVPTSSPVAQVGLRCGRHLGSCHCLGRRARTLTHRSPWTYAVVRRQTTGHSVRSLFT